MVDCGCSIRLQHSGWWAWLKVKWRRETACCHCKDYSQRSTVCSAWWGLQHHLVTFNSFFLADRYDYNVVHLSVMASIVAKLYVLQQKFLNKWIGSALYNRNSTYNVWPPTVTRALKLPTPKKFPTKDWTNFYFFYKFFLARSALYL